MSRFTTFTTANGFQAARGEVLTAVTGLPGWARLIVGVLALPGICLIALSLVLLVASIATLLLLTAPAYALLRRMVTPKQNGQSPTTPSASASVVRPTRHVEATVIDPQP